MYYLDLFHQVANPNNIRAMRFSRLMSRSRLSTAAIAILLVPIPQARAADKTPAKSTLLSTTPDRLVFAPRELHFGRVAVGRRKVQTVTVTNSGDANVTLLQIAAQGMRFTLNGLDLPVTLASGESYTFSCAFAPVSARASRGSISLISEVSDVSDVSDVPNPILMLELSGTGSDNDWLVVNPATMNFGTVQVGSSATQPGTLTTSANPVTISSANISSTEYTLSGVSFPLTVPAWSSQRFLVTFTPQESGVAWATVDFVDSTGTGPLAVESLSGVGSVSQGHSVDLSWTASNSQDVIGYNIYRGLKSGGPYSKINSVLDASTGYTDNTVINGTTYYYVSTAVNSNDEESVYSNEAQAVIP
jgi:ASPM-SPD-2-Hydin domain-containing protein